MDTFILYIDIHSHITGGQDGGLAKGMDGGGMNSCRVRNIHVPQSALLRELFFSAHIVISMLGSDCEDVWTTQYGDFAVHQTTIRILESRMMHYYDDTDYAQVAPTHIDAGPDVSSLE